MALPPDRDAAAEMVRVANEARVVAGERYQSLITQLQDEAFARMTRETKRNMLQQFVDARARSAQTIEIYGVLSLQFGERFGLAWHEVAREPKALLKKRAPRLYSRKSGLRPH